MKDPIRRIMAVLIAAILIAPAAAMGATNAASETDLPSKTSDGSSQLVGHWSCLYMEYQGITSDPDGLFASLVLDIREDGTGTLSTNEGVELNELICDPDQQELRFPVTAWSYRLEGDKLFCTIDPDTAYIFIRGDLPSGTDSPAEPADVSQVIGFWRIDQRQNMDSGVIRERSDLDAIGYDMTLEITEDSRYILRTYSNGYLLDERIYSYEPQPMSGNYLILMLDGQYPQLVLIEDDRITLSINEDVLQFMRADPEDVRLPSDEGAETSVTEDVIGSWQLVEMRDTRDGPVDLTGFEETVEYTADGVCTMKIYYGGELASEDHYTYTIQAPGVLLINGRYLEHYTVENDHLTITEPDTSMVFRRIRPDDPAADPADH